MGDHGDLLDWILRNELGNFMLPITTTLKHFKKRQQHPTPKTLATIRFSNLKSLWTEVKDTKDGFFIQMENGQNCNLLRNCVTAVIYLEGYDDSISECDCFQLEFQTCSQRMFVTSQLNRNIGWNKRRIDLSHPFDNFLTQKATEQFHLELLLRLCDHLILVTKEVDFTLQQIVTDLHSRLQTEAPLKKIEVVILDSSTNTLEKSFFPNGVKTSSIPFASYPQILSGIPLEATSTSGNVTNHNRTLLEVIDDTLSSYWSDWKKGCLKIENDMLSCTNLQPKMWKQPFPLTSETIFYDHGYLPYLFNSAAPPVHPISMKFILTVDSKIEVWEDLNGTKYGITLDVPGFKCQVLNLQNFMLVSGHKKETKYFLYCLPLPDRVKDIMPVLSYTDGMLDIVFSLQGKLL